MIKEVSPVARINATPCKIRILAPGRIDTIDTKREYDERNFCGFSCVRSFNQALR
jgi:hypothetical protein